MNRAFILIALFLFLLIGEVRAEFYRWVDKDGREFVTNDREKVPSEYRNTATPVQIDDSRVSVGQQPSSKAKTGAAPREHRDRYGRGEEYWRKRASKLRKDLSALEVKRDVLKKQEQEANAKNELRPATAEEKKKGTSLRKKIQTLDKDIAVKKRELEIDLPEEARKADAYPGWIRE